MLVLVKNVTLNILFLIHIIDMERIFFYKADEEFRGKLKGEWFVKLHWYQVLGFSSLCDLGALCAGPQGVSGDIKGSHLWKLLSSPNLLIGGHPISLQEKVEIAIVRQLVNQNKTHVQVLSGGNYIFSQLSLMNSVPLSFHIVSISASFH